MQHYFEERFSRKVYLGDFMLDDLAEIVVQYLPRHQLILALSNVHNLSDEEEDLLEWSLEAFNLEQLNDGYYITQWHATQKFSNDHLPIIHALMREGRPMGDFSTELYLSLNNSRVSRFDVKSFSYNSSTLSYYLHHLIDRALRPDPDYWPEFDCSIQEYHDLVKHQVIIFSADAFLGTVNYYHYQGFEQEYTLYRNEVKAIVEKVGIIGRSNHVLPHAEEVYVC